MSLPVLNGVEYAKTNQASTHTSTDHTLCRQAFHLASCERWAKYCTGILDTMYMNPMLWFKLLKTVITLLLQGMDPGHFHRQKYQKWNSQRVYIKIVITMDVYLFSVKEGRG